MANNFSLDPNCVALWRFENGALTVDSIGGNTLTNVNSVTADTVNYREGLASADFDSGSGQYFYIQNADLDAGFPLKNGDTEKKITVCFWWTPQTVVTGKYFFAIWDGGTNKRSFAIAYKSVVGVLVASGYNGGALYEEKTFGVPLTAGVPYHIGITLDGVNKTALIRIRNGSTGNLLGPNASQVFANETWVGDPPLNIGTTNLSTSFCINGLVDELVVFKDIKTSDQIDEIYAGTYTGVTATTTTTTTSSTSTTTTSTSSTTTSTSTTTATATATTTATTTTYPHFVLSIVIA